MANGLWASILCHKCLFLIWDPTLLKCLPGLLETSGRRRRLRMPPFSYEINSSKKRTRLHHQHRLYPSRLPSISIILTP